MAKSASRRTSRSKKSASRRPSIFNIKYGGAFQDAMNTLYSPSNINSTTASVKQLEPQHGPFQVGKFNRYLLPAGLVPRGFDFDQFEKDFGLIPDYLRQRVSDVLRANFHAPNPLPVFSKVSENLDDSSDVIIRPFVYKNQTYIGILYLCPSSKLPPP
jgi:hypothetical protein